MSKENVGKGKNGDEQRNRKVFRRCLKTESDGAQVMSDGS